MAGPSRLAPLPDIHPQSRLELHHPSSLRSCLQGHLAELIGTLLVNSLLAVSGDFGDKAEAAHAVWETVDRCGGLNVLINNAAEQHAQKEVTDISEARLKRTFATNIFVQFCMV